MNIILAPHIDDEMIGCSELLFTGKIDKVVYFYDITNVRIDEAIEMAKAFKVDISFEGFKFKPKKDDILYIPCQQDMHEHHKAVNLAYRFHDYVKYYSVDKNFRQLPIRENNRKIKKDILDRFYPSQKELWANDAKYYIFESILDSDEEVFIFCTEQFEGYHYWDKAKNYLKYIHRHIFHVKLYIKVYGDDREIEFIKVKNELKKFLDKHYTMKKFRKSCEMIAREIKKHFEEKYMRQVKVEVSEDGENGAIIF